MVEPNETSSSDYYPARRGDSRTNFERFSTWLSSNEGLTTIRCETAVEKCLKNSLLVRTMMFALRQAGCDIDIRRHISCEPCHHAVTGGFDVEMNQIVVCQNASLGQEAVESNLAHEMIHMFDFCRAKLDFKNPYHVACSEVRAANLLHCSFMTSFAQGSSSPLNYHATHKVCVRNKAIHSVMAANSLTRPQAEEAVDKVFPICYNDLEPIGRRIRRKSDDIELSYRERYLSA